MSRATSGLPHPLVAIGQIAWTTYRVAMRGRLLAVTGVVGLLLFVAGLLGAQLNQLMLTRLLIDFGLAAGSIVGSLLAITMALHTYDGELSGRRAEPILVRPIGRPTVLLGKALGIIWVVLTYVLSVALLTLSLIAASGGTLGDAFWPAWMLVAMEVMLTVALSLLVATQCNTALAASVTGALWLAGNLSEDLKLLGKGAPTTFTARAVEVAFHLLPDLGRLSLRAAAANALEVPQGYLSAAILYGAAYTVTCLVLTTWAYTRPQKI